MVKKQIVTGILSYGMSGRVFHAPFIAVNPNFEFRAVVERSLKSAQEKYPDVISYDSVQELLDDPEIELVIVNTPNDTHVSYAEQALLAGKHVLIEKPFAPTSQEAAKLYKLAEEQGKHILPYHNRRFDSDFLTLKNIVEFGAVGRPIELHLRFDRYKSQIGVKLFKETKRAASGILYDLGSHLLDQAISLFGKPKSMSKLKGTYRANSVVDDYAHLMLNYASGVNVFITTSLLVADPQAAFVLHGTKGSYVKYRTDVQEAQLLDGLMPDHASFGLEPLGNEGVLSIALQDDVMERQLIEPVKGDYMAVFDAVYATIREGIPYFVSKEQIIWQLEILEPTK